ncbi:hypothetical protein D6850_11525 [Roseovarius spongiae]|uniref:Metalloprotease n=1 Tax=Roseovarius spongiae TaxID=2320272 RepID=A0A3A8AW62_9RHOB|nr:hypothetical protein [Roseovarius spongiae]RKF13824.1 hypothetical protein D6850_11525 [Roseovarius spongiae]
MRGPRTYLRACAMAAAALAAAPAAASCAGPFQFPVEDLEASVVRQILVTTRDEIERFFDFRFDAFCMDEEEYGAYYDIRGNTLVVGVQFFLDVANPPGNINRAIGVIAHEAAHAFQTKHGLLDMLVETNPHRVKCIELHADFLAGGYMGWRARLYDVDVTNLTEMFYDLGDQQMQADGHHGLGAERFLSFRQGFQTVTDNEITLSSMGIAYVSQAKCD